MCVREWFTCSLPSLFTLSMFGVSVADLPAPRLAPFSDFQPYVSPLITCLKVGDICPRPGLEQPFKTNPPKIRKTIYKKKFFSLNLLKFNEFYLESV